MSTCAATSRRPRRIRILRRVAQLCHQGGAAQDETSQARVKSAWAQLSKPKDEAIAFKLCLQFKVAPLHQGNGGVRGSDAPGRAVQVDSIKIHVERVYGFSA